jgi:hypothetical protein
MARFAAALLLAFMHAAVLAQAPDRVAALDWMAGTWTHEGGKVTESWIGPSHGVMVAANLTVGANGRVSHEFLRIADTAAGMTYFASPSGRAAVEFPLKSLAARRVVFENPAHDFPQRILYWRDGDALVARIEGTLRGSPRHQEWRFTPQTGVRP